MLTILKKVAYAGCLWFTLTAQAAVLSAEDAFQWAWHTEGSLLHFDVTIADGYFLYGDTIKVHEPNTKTALKILDLPPGKPLHNNTHPVLQGKLHFVVPITSEHESLALSFQGCSAEVCFLPQTQIITPHEGLTLWKLLGFWGLGVLLAFTPCMLPMLPIVVGIVLHNQAALPMMTRVLKASTYVLGMASSYAALGWLTHSTLGNLVLLLQSRYVLMVLVGVCVFLGLAQLGLIHLTLPASWQTRIHHATHKIGTASLFSLWLLGALSSLVLSPCVTPPLVAALGYAAHSNTAWQGMAALFLLATGMGSPLVLLSVVGTHLLPRSGRLMRTSNDLLAGLLFATALFLLGRLVPEQWVWPLWALLGISALLRLTHHHNPRLYWGLGLASFLGMVPFVMTMQPSTHTMLHTVTDRKTLHSALAHAKLQNRPVILDFYADWCQACKRLNKTLTDPKYQAFLDGARWIRVDITAATPDQLKLLSEYAVIAPPTLVMLKPAEGSWRAEQIVGETAIEALADTFVPFAANGSKVPQS